MLQRDSNNKRNVVVIKFRLSDTFRALEPVWIEFFDNSILCFHNS